MDAWILTAGPTTSNLRLESDNRILLITDQRPRRRPPKHQETRDPLPLLRNKMIVLLTTQTSVLGSTYALLLAEVHGEDYGQVRTFRNTSSFHKTGLASADLR